MNICAPAPLRDSGARDPSRGSEGIARMGYWEESSLAFARRGSSDRRGRSTSFTAEIGTSIDPFAGVGNPIAFATTAGVSAKGAGLRLATEVGLLRGARLAAASPCHSSICRACSRSIAAPTEARIFASAAISARRIGLRPA